MHPNDRQITIETKVSTYDSVNAFLISALAVVGPFVVLLFLVWLTIQPIEFVRNAEPDMSSRVVETAVAVLSEPMLTDFPVHDDDQIDDQIQVMSTAVSFVQSRLDTSRSNEKSHHGHRFDGRETNRENGSEIVPEHKRWRIEYSAKSIENYSEQLDYFGIDIGIISTTSNDVIRLNQPGSTAQLIYSNRRTENKARSLFFVHDNTDLQRWDKILAERKLSNLDDRFTVQFFPDSTKQNMRNVERLYLKNVGKPLTDVQSTRFQVVENGDSFAIRVLTMEYQ